MRRSNAVTSRLCLRSLAACVTLLAAMVWRPADAAAPIRFERLGLDEGLSQQAVLAIGQDARGFIWVGTEDGLNRFDGFSFQHTADSGVRLGGLESAFVTHIETDAAGKLWIATDGNGVLVRDPVSGRFTVPWSASATDAPDLSAARTVKVDARGRVWIGTRDAGVVVHDPRQRTFKRLRHDSNDAATLSADAIHSLLIVRGGVWVGTDRGLDYIDDDLAKPAQRYVLASSAHAAESRAVRALLEDRTGALWVGTDHGLIRLDRRTGEQTLFQADARNSSALPSNEVQVLLEDSAHRLWVGTTAGLALYDPQDNGFDTYTHDAADPASLPDDRIVSLFQDRGGLLWVGTQLAGVAKWNPRSWSFGHRVERGAPAAVNNVTSFTQDQTGRIWVGTFGGGLRAVDAVSGSTRRWRPHHSHPDPFDDDAIMALLTDHSGAIWVGTMSTGLIRIAPDRSRADVYRHDAARLNSLPVDGVMSLLEDATGRVWVGTFGGGLVRFEPATNDFRSALPDTTAVTPLRTGRVTALAEDKDGRIWAGTDGAGLHVLTSATSTTRQWLHDPADAGSLGANTIYAVHIDASGTLWIGTHGRGLDRANATTHDLSRLHFAHYREAQGLPDNTVYAVLTDDENTLWLSTGHGLAWLSAQSVRSFHRGHGLQGEEFNFGAAFRSNSGQLYFGGTNGYNSFRPRQLQFNTHPPSVALTGVSILNQPIRTSVPYDKLRELQLGYRAQVVTFDFAALDFASPRENRYRYRLEGFDTSWMSASTRRSATYTRLAGGSYTFRVQAANADGRWGGAELALPLQVEAPPWQRTSAYICYAAALLLMLFAASAIWRRKREREKRYREELETEVRDRTREIAQRNSELEEANRKLQEASLTDPLTGLANRRALMQALPVLAAACHIERRLTPPPRQIILMIVDLDYFKPINDCYGHEAGDEVLKQVAAILRDCVRHDDLAVRWGGDEFVVVYTSAALDEGAGLAERIRTRIAKHHFRLSNGVTARTSCSIGFVCYPFVQEAPHLMSHEQALNVADTALLEAKSQRNAWIGWGGTPTAHDITGLFSAIDTNPSAVAARGALHVLTSQYRPEDTVEELIRKARGR